MTRKQLEGACRFMVLFNDHDVDIAVINGMYGLRLDEETSQEEALTAYLIINGLNLEYDPTAFRKIDDINAKEDNDSLLKNINNKWEVLGKRNRKRVIHRPTGGAWEYVMGVKDIDGICSKEIYGGENGDKLIATVHDQETFAETDANALLLLHASTFLAVLKFLSIYLTLPEFTPKEAKKTVDEYLSWVEWEFDMEEEGNA